MVLELALDDAGAATRLVKVGTMDDEVAEVEVAGPPVAEALGVASLTEMGVGVVTNAEVTPSSSQSPSSVSSPSSPSSSSQSPSSSSSSSEVEAVAGALVSVPFRPPVTPAAAKRWRASSSVSQTRLVPFLLTRGRAKQSRSAAQGFNDHFPETHWAN